MVELNGPWRRQRYPLRSPIGADVGVELGTPVGLETIGDLAEYGARPQCALGTIVCRWNVLVGYEHEYMPSDFLDDALELDAGVARWLERHHGVEAGVQLGLIGFQCRVGERWPSSTDAAGAPE